AVGEAALHFVTIAELRLGAQACSKVAIGTCSSRPFVTPLAFRGTTPALGSMPVTTAKWFAALRLPGPVPEGFGVEYDDDPALFGQILLQRVDAGLDVVGLDPVVREQHRQVSDIGVGGGVPDRSGTCRARRALGQVGDLLLGGLVAGDLTDHISYRHLPA